MQCGERLAKASLTKPVGRDIPFLTCASDVAVAVTVVLPMGKVFDVMKHLDTSMGRGRAEEEEEGVGDGDIEKEGCSEAFLRRLTGEENLGLVHNLVLTAVDTSVTQVRVTRRVHSSIL